MSSLKNNNLPWLRLPDLITALSLSNLCFLRIWSELLAVNAGTTYFVHVYPLDYIVIMLNVVALGFVLALAAGAVRKADHKHGRLIVILGVFTVILLPLNEARTEFTTMAAGDLVRFAFSPGGVLLGCMVMGLGSYLFIRKQHHVARLARTLTIVFAPSILFTFASATWNAFQLAEPASTIPKQRLIANATPRAPVVIIIFDELDRRLVFDERPVSVALPEFDRLRAQSIEADSAFSPSFSTSTSIPSMLTGLPPEKDRTARPSDIKSLFFAEDPSNWARKPNLFEDARRAGLRTAVVGWYHPYCQLLIDLVQSCAWAPVGYASHGTPLGAFATARRQLVSILPWGTRLHHHELYSVTFAGALSALNSPFDLIYLHLPVPHPPWIFDRRSTRFALGNTRRDGYFDNVVLADRTLGQLRRQMETRHSWDAATVIVTADHPWRNAKSWDGKFDARIPFFVKLPGQRANLHFTTTVQTLHFRGFVTRLVASRETDPLLVKDWFKEYSDTVPIHATHLTE